MSPHITEHQWIERVANASRLLSSKPVVSSWFDVQQDAIDLYARSVRDPDPVHVDPAWAKANSPYGGTIAAGLWGASMLVAMLHETGLLKPIEQELGTSFGLNYGFDRLRFCAPLRCGSRIRARFTPEGLAMRQADQALVRLHAQLEIDGKTSPALAGDWLILYLRPDHDGEFNG